MCASFFLVVVASVASPPAGWGGGGTTAILPPLSMKYDKRRRSLPLRRLDFFSREGFVSLVQRVPRFRVFPISFSHGFDLSPLLVLPVFFSAWFSFA